MARRLQPVFEEGERPRIRGLCSERDWGEWERRLADGEDPSAAARSFGRTATDFRKTDYFRHQRALRLGREARADVADERLDLWANAADASDTLRIYWHRYLANAAGRGIERQQVELVAGQGELPDRSASLADVAEVLREAGALKALERGGADGKAERVERRLDAGGEVADPAAVLAASADG